MKVICLIFCIAISHFPFAQNTTTIFGSFGDYKLEHKKIYEIGTDKSERLIASISGNKIYKDTSTLDKDVLYIIVDKNVYRSVQIRDSLLYYIDGKGIYKRAKNGKFDQMGGAFDSKKNGQFHHFVTERISPLEYFAILIAEKDIDPNKYL